MSLFLSFNRSIRLNKCFDFLSFCRLAFLVRTHHSRASSINDSAVDRICQQKPLTNSNVSFRWIPHPMNPYTESLLVMPWMTYTGISFGMHQFKCPSPERPRHGKLVILVIECALNPSRNARYVLSSHTTKFRSQGLRELGELLGRVESCLVFYI